ncbi:MAG: malectin domain-containing carbohydrate-binding protein, partial [Candidatus Hydrogenedentes bacterium]|nr:malectin domain-containing carbohydrate-binding protein [Candidatus Hydrogenedentota bacterium]
KPTWNRYANPESSKWSNDLTGSETLILRFLDMLIRLGHTGQDGAIVKARDAGRAWLNNMLLEQWAKFDTWGRYYWDWECPVYSIAGVWAAQYVIDNRDAFPNWRTDARNVLTLMINRTCVDPNSAGDAYSGAWAIPESPSCCGKSLSYGQQILAAGLAQYSTISGDPLTREMARRMAILGAYDALDNGAVVDGLDGTPVVAAGWLNIIHPLALRFTLQTMSWLPELFGPARENHIMRTSGEVVSVTYAKRRVAYKTFDAPANSVDVLRLALAPATVTADGNAIERRTDLGQNGYVIAPLANGDCILSIRHDATTSIVVEGADPQETADIFRDKEPPLFGFTGNQVRIIGDAGPSGGLADVCIDGIKQRAGIDCWNPDWREEQVLFSKSGLQNAHHEMLVVIRGEKNLKSNDTAVRLRTVQYSGATGDNGFASGAQIPAIQRMVFGYAGRADLRDARGNDWKPATEWFARLGGNTDSVAATWWSTPAEGDIAGADSPDLYRYGAHAASFTVNVTVGPGELYAILKFAATRGIDTAKNLVTVSINGEKVVDKLDVAAKAGGQNKAIDLEFRHLKPKNGIIELKFEGGDTAAGIPGEAFVQALEVGPEPRP